MFCAVETNNGMAHGGGHVGGYLSVGLCSPVLGLGAKDSPLERKGGTWSLSRRVACLSPKRTAPCQSLLGFHKAQTEAEVVA